MPKAIAAADCFLVVVDAGWDSSIWMGEEVHMAEKSGLPIYFWNPERVHVKGMLRYLQRQLPDDPTDAAAMVGARLIPALHATIVLVLF